MNYNNNYENTSQRDKRAVLEHAVLTKSPEEIAALCQQLGHVENSARALGLACRFRGLSYVKALVEGGADFTYKRPEDEGGYYTIDYWLAPLEMNNVLLRATFVNRTDSCFSSAVMAGKERIGVLPIEQRVEIVKYLYDNREKVCLDAGELLYYALMSGSKKIAGVLKTLGAGFSDQRIEAITENGRSYEWMEFCTMSDSLKDEEYIEVLSAVAAELGGKRFHYTESVYWGNYSTYYDRDRLYKPEIFRFILEHFNQKKMNKTKLMRGVIDKNSVTCLELCAENGWLDTPRKRDEMIRYASEHSQTECSAWLLEFKNRTADFAAERDRAEKRMMRELNANPNSVTELKKIWGYEKCEDGTLVITRYKGSSTEVEVPEKIGSSVVAKIGDWAFSPGAPRLRKEQSALRRAITRITLPETICAIGDGAFYDCRALIQINVPDSVTAIGMRAFGCCDHLCTIDLPDGITRIGGDAFMGCDHLRAIKLPEGITEISAYTFGGCLSLKRVVIPKTVEVIYRQAFYNCSALESAVIPEGVIEIKQQVFAGCTSLRSVVLPASLQKIKNYTRGYEPETIFGKNADVTVTVAPKSYAEKYCRRNDIHYIYPAGQ